MFFAIADSSAIVAAALITAIGGPAIVAAFRYGKRAAVNAATAVTHEAVDLAKDELIETLESNHQALKDRVDALGTRLKLLKKALDDAETKARQLKAELQAALTYTAPEAVERVQTMLTAHADLLALILERATGIEGKLDVRLGSVESRLEAVSEVWKRQS